MVFGVCCCDWGTLGGSGKRRGEVVEEEGEGKYVGENTSAGVGCWRYIGVVRNYNKTVAYFIRPSFSPTFAMFQLAVREEKSMELSCLSTRFPYYRTRAFHGIYTTDYIDNWPKVVHCVSIHSLGKNIGVSLFHFW